MFMNAQVLLRGQSGSKKFTSFGVFLVDFLQQLLDLIKGFLHLHHGSSAIDDLL